MPVLFAKCPQDEIDRVWQVASTQLASAVSQSMGRYELEDVYWLLCSGHMQLWLAADGQEIIASCVTQVSEYPKKTLLSVVFLGGSKLHLFLDVLLEKLKAFASANHCEAIDLAGRKGWSRVLGKHGFQQSGHIFMELPVNE